MRMRSAQSFPQKSFFVQIGRINRSLQSARRDFITEKVCATAAVAAASRSIGGGGGSARGAAGGGAGRLPSSI
jgi:hypothetical protein